jgi:hypothetical protein
VYLFLSRGTLDARRLKLYPRCNYNIVGSARGQVNKNHENATIESDCCVIMRASRFCFHWCFHGRGAGIVFLGAFKEAVGALWSAGFDAGTRLGWILIRTTER